MRELRAAVAALAAVAWAGREGAAPAAALGSAAGLQLVKGKQQDQAVGRLSLLLQQQQQLAPGQKPVQLWRLLGGRAALALVLQQPRLRWRHLLGQRQPAELDGSAGPAELAHHQPLSAAQHWVAARQA